MLGSEICSVLRSNTLSGFFLLCTAAYTARIQTGESSVCVRACACVCVPKRVHQFLKTCNKTGWSQAETECHSFQTLTL